MEWATNKLVLAMIILGSCVGLVNAQSETIDEIFTLRILPTMKEKCFGCHGQDVDDIRGDYNMLSREHLIAGGESGDPAVVAGQPQQSPLYSAIRWEDLEMPPKENDRLTELEIEYFRKWIEAGAPWPDEKQQQAIRQRQSKIQETKDGVLVKTSGGTSTDWTYRRYKKEDIWAFEPLTKTQPPFTNTDQSPIDAFVNQKLSDAKLVAADQADARTLIRRATYDLIGLPPTPQQTKKFLAAYELDAESAWADLIDRLLASDHYGERWAQHWLDVVRYADTAGLSNDYELSNAWRYRDYVIRSFNADKPFNLFVKEQIAGDELRPDDPEAIIATGMLRMGPWGTQMIQPEEARQVYLDDLVHNVGQSFLSMPMRCCKCHDHKFDPMPTRDYYRMYATFATTQPAEVEAPFLPEENLGGFDEKKELVDELLAYATTKKNEILDKQETAAKKWYAEHDLPYKNERDRKKDPQDKKPPRHCGLTYEEQGKKKVREQDVWIWTRRMERFQPLAQSVYNGQDEKRESRKLRVAKKIDTNWRPENFILAGGALDATSDRVTPGVLSPTGLATNPQAEDPYAITDSLNGRRLAFANWVVDDRNPLTARSIVNRIWQYHFGKGLVKTANNFGVKGSRPTHPELLDWLTNDFIDNGWKIKRMHRMIMMSDAYRRSGRAVNPKHLASVDPENKLLAVWQPRRLTAEELRDSTLQISGELNREMGGVPIMPEINMEVALQPRMIQFSIAPAHQPSRTPSERNRRTIYAYRVRGQADPMLEIMNLPNPNESCEMRDSAAVTPQAFTLFNSDVMNDRSIGFAIRLETEAHSTDAARISRAIELAFNRPATPQEIDNLESYLKKMKAYHADHEPEEIKYPTQVVRSLVEEFTGEPFEFIEILNVYKNYVPDAKPWTVSADTRALADVCLLLINSNEFLYVY